MQKKYNDMLKDLTNIDARRFFYAYYSGEIKKSLEFATMFTYFVNFIRNVCELDIEESDENRKELMLLIDSDRNLSIDMKELNAFFEGYVNLDNKEVRLKLAKKLNIKSEFPTVNLKVEVLFDFEEGDERLKISGILKKDDVLNLPIPEGNIVEFGKAGTCKVWIPDNDLDDI